MFKPKAQQFRKQIRRQYLNEYFKKKRKQFALISQPQPQKQTQTLQKLNKTIHDVIEQNNKMVPEKGIVDSGDLEIVTKFSQTQMGVQCILKTDIPCLILPYLSPIYYNKKQQHLATCFFVNITYLRPQNVPSHQFMRNITNIIQNTDLCQQQGNNNSLMNQQIDTIDNCLLIIYNLMSQFQQVKKFYIEECDLINLLYHMFQTSVSMSLHIIEKMLKVLSKVTIYFIDKKQKKVIRKFLKFYLTILQNSTEILYIYLALTNIKTLLFIYFEDMELKNNYCRSYEISLNESVNPPKINEAEKQLQDIQKQIEKSRLLQKIFGYYRLKTYKLKLFFTRETLTVIKMLMPALQKDTVKNKVLKLLNQLIDKIYQNQTNGHQQSNSLQYFTSQNKQQTNQQQSTVDVKAQFYQIIYQFLQIWSSDHQILVNHELYEKICQRYEQFQQTNSSNSISDMATRKYFIYIFGMLVYSGKLTQRTKGLLKQSIERYRMSNEMHENVGNLEQQEIFTNFINSIEGQLQGMDMYQL